MDTLTKQVNRALRRLTIQKFLSVTTWTTFATLLLAVLAVVLDRIWGPWGLTLQQVGWTILAAAGTGIVAGAIWAVVTRPQAIDAAIELDKRYGLKERVSSALALAPQDYDTPAGRALLEDAERRVRQVEVSEQFRFQLRPTALLPIVPCALAFLIVLLIPPVEKKEATASTSGNKLNSKVVKEEVNDLKVKIRAQRKKAEKENLKQASELFKKLEEGLGETTREDKKQDPKEALVKLNKLADQIEERKRKLGDSKQFKQQLDRLKQLGKGPADKFGDALKEGDMKKAVDELKKLQQSLNNGKLDKEAQAALQKQLQAMQQQLEKMAQEHEQLKQQLADKAEELKKKGLLDQADQVLQQLDKLSQNDPQMQKLQDLAKKLQQCKNCMKEGDAQGAAQQLAEAEQNLKQMMDNLEEMKMLEEAMQQIADAKAGMCEGQGQGQGKMGMKMAKGLGQGQGKGKGNGLGAGAGAGRRPEQEEDVKFRNTKAKTQTGSGTAVVVGEGPKTAYKGRATEEIKAQIEADRKEMSDPLNEQVLPRKYREHAKEFFQKLRQGE